MKYYQQSLVKPAESMTDQEKEKFQSESKKFIEKHHYFGPIFKDLIQDDQDWILEHMSEGKGVIPYEMMNSFELLKIIPTDNLFSIDDFYSSLKNSVITEKEHAAVKNLYTLLKMRNLGDLNNLYNFQDKIILCEIFESRAQFVNDKFEFNPRKCNSARSFSGCVQRDKSKCIIALPTQTEHVELFQKTLIGRFSCVNTRLAFDSQILLPHDKKKTRFRSDV